MRKVEGWLAMIGLLLAMAAQADEQRLRIHGSNTIGERLMPELVEAWLRSAGQNQVTRQQMAFEEIVLHSTGALGVVDVEMHAHGSSTAFTDLIAGTADLGMASRRVSAAEIANATHLGRLDSAQQEIVLALDGLAIIVPTSNSMQTISLIDVQRLFSGQIVNWNQLGQGHQPVSLFARDERSGTWDSFRQVVLAELPLAPGAKRFESTAELAAAVAADRGGVGFVGLTGVAGVRALPVSHGGDALPPSAQEVAVEDYPLSRRLYLYVPEKPAPLAAALLEFARSDEAQIIVERIGFVSQRIRAYQPTMRAGSSEAYRSLVEGAVRLSVNFRFNPASAALDNKAQQDVDRLREFMRQPAQRNMGLILVGFADGAEVMPVQAEQLSSERADQVAAALLANHIPVEKVRGVGDTAPVAPRSSALGPVRNRRVEVWMRRSN